MGMVAVLNILTLIFLSYIMGLNISFHSLGLLLSFTFNDASEDVFKINAATATTTPVFFYSNSCCVLFPSWGKSS